MKLIPAIDLRGGKVVRLSQGDDKRRTSYDVTPRQMLNRYGEAGIKLVHVVDLDAAFGEEPQRELIAELAGVALGGGPKIELGGGLRDHGSVEWALGAGCERVILGSLVARNFDAFAQLVTDFPNQLVPAVEIAKGELRVAGWTRSAEMTLADLLKKLRGLACPAVLVTDVERDGLMEGPNLDLARSVGEQTGIPAIVSGGVRSADDIREAARIATDTGHLEGVIVGKAIYEGLFTLEEALAATVVKD